MPSLGSHALHQDRVTFDGKTLYVPRELHAAMREPRKVRLYVDDESNWFIYRATLLTTLRTHARHLLGGVTDGSAAPPHFARPAGGDESFVVYRANRALGGDGKATYTITNYHPTYCLMPADEEPEHASRQTAWASMKGYHEHRWAHEQEESSNRLSAWLVRDVLTSFDATSFLEIGCGGGRNLLWLSRELPQADLHGVEINRRAIETARAQVPSAHVRVGSLYELDAFADRSIDVTYTSGVLEHVPHDRVASVIREMHRIARRAVVHFELHGPSHRFDYHRYPRDYARLYRELFPSNDFEFEIFPRSDFRARSFEYSVLTAGAHSPSPAVTERSRPGW